MTTLRPSRAAIDDGIRNLIARHRGAADDASALDPDLSLGPEGVGFDSVALVEMLLTCEQMFGVRLPADVFERQALTIRAVGDAIERAVVTTTSGDT
jgi:acyl carrier protein